MTRVFLDANVLVAAAASFRGGSAFILEGCRQGRFQGFVSRLVLLEAERNIRKNLHPDALRRFHRWLEAIPFQVVPPPSEGGIRIHQALVNEKGAPVLAAAAASGAEIFLTLDQKGFLNQRKQLRHLPVQILAPKEFLDSLRRRKGAVLKSSLGFFKSPVRLHGWV